MDKHWRSIKVKSNVWIAENSARANWRGRRHRASEHGTTSKKRWVLNDTTGIELPAAERRAIDLEGRLVKELALTDLVHAIREYRKLAASKPLTLQESDYAHAVQELNKAIDRAECLIPL